MHAHPACIFAAELVQMRGIDLWTSACADRDLWCCIGLDEIKIKHDVIRLWSVWLFC